MFLKYLLIFNSPLKIFVFVFLLHENFYKYVNYEIGCCINYLGCPGYSDINDAVKLPKCHICDLDSQSHTGIYGANKRDKSLPLSA